MRNFFVLLTAIGISSCTVGKKHMPSDQADDTANTQEKHGFTKKNHDSIVIYCGKDSIFYDSKLGFIRSSNNAHYCLREKAFLGDTTACRQIATVIPLMRNPFSVYDEKLRGQILFKAVLDRLHNFEFVPGPNGDMDFYTYYGSYASVMSEMIVSIDEMSQYDYLNKHIYTKGRTELESEELFSPKYIQILARLSWETYKEAYDKGLIKLKAFGQE